MTTLSAWDQLQTLGNPPTREITHIRKKDDVITHIKTSEGKVFKKEDVVQDIDSEIAKYFITENTPVHAVAHK
jgi:hypothetical protein